MKNAGAAGAAGAVALALLTVSCDAATSSVVLAGASTEVGGLELSLDHEHTSCDRQPSYDEVWCSVMVSIVNTSSGPQNVSVSSARITTTEGQTFAPEDSTPASGGLNPQDETAALFMVTLPGDAEADTVEVSSGSRTVTFAWPG